MKKEKQKQYRFVAPGAGYGIKIDTDEVGEHYRLNRHTVAGKGFGGSLPIWEEGNPVSMYVGINGFVNAHELDPEDIKEILETLIAWVTARSDYDVQTIEVRRGTGIKGSARRAGDAGWEINVEEEEENDETNTGHI